MFSFLLNIYGMPIVTKLGKFDRIVIYQYGKVGSSTILTNLCKWLNTRFPGTSTKIPDRTYPKVIHIHDPKIMKDILNRYQSVLIINATRNLYHRQISEFFQQSKNKQKIKTQSMPELTDALLENSIYRLNDWYERFEKLLGFTLEPFDYRKHYSLTTKRTNRPVLIIRLEDSKSWQRIFQQLIHDRIRFTAKTNLSKDCWYGAKYTEFKEYFRYPVEAADRLAESDTHHRFYQDLNQLPLDLPIDQ